MKLNPVDPVNPVADPEEAMQEHGSWFTDLVMWLFITAPAIPLVIYCAAMVLTALGIVIHHFTR